MAKRKAKEPIFELKKGVLRNPNGSICRSGIAWTGKYWMPLNGKDVERNGKIYPALTSEQLKEIYDTNPAIAKKYIQAPKGYKALWES